MTGKLPAPHQEYQRYQRQLILPMIGEAGQERLFHSRVVVVGCGATGTVLTNHLARAGVGRLLVVDRDFVELNNLQRQLLFTEEEVRQGMPKAIAAAEWLRRVNSEIVVEGRVQDVTAANVETLVEECDLVMDGTDNFETRYLLNDACVKLGKSWVYCGAISTYGMVARIDPGRTPCLRCMFPEPPPAGSAATCDTAGVLGPAVGVIASLSAVEGLRCLVGANVEVEEGTGSLIHLDVWTLTWHRLQMRRKETCPCCAARQFPFLQASASSQAVSLCGRDGVQITPVPPVELDLEALAARLRQAGEVTLNPYLLKFRSQAGVLTVFPDGRAIIQGAPDEAAARTLYARYVGS